MKQSKEQKKAKRPGQPTKYDPKYCDMIIEASRRGETIEMFACSIDVHRDTLHHWRKEHPEFFDAFNKAKILQEQFMQKMGLAGMSGKIPGFSQAAWIFWMKARFRYNDQPALDPDEDITDFGFEAK